MRQPLNENNILENPTINDVVEVVLVEGTDKSYKSPE